MGQIFEFKISASSKLCSKISLDTTKNIKITEGKTCRLIEGRLKSVLKTIIGRHGSPLFSGFWQDPSKNCFF
jgi:hypothetical protein